MGDDRAAALRLMSHETLVLIASDLMGKALDSMGEPCRYCGVRSGEEFPRPSYYEMRTLLAEVSAANADGEGGHEDLWEAVDEMASYFADTRRTEANQ